MILGPSKDWRIAHGYSERAKAGNQAAQDGGDHYNCACISAFWALRQGEHPAATGGRDGTQVGVPSGRVGHMGAQGDQRLRERHGIALDQRHLLAGW